MTKNEKRTVKIERTDKFGRKTLSEYETVASRLHRFIEDQKAAGNKYCLTTTIVGDANNVNEAVLIKCIISIENAEGKPINQASGHAYEKAASSFINKTSHVENAETSAIGRALAGLGYMGTEIASAEELANALKNQSGGSNMIMRDSEEPAPKATKDVEVIPAPEELTDLSQWVLPFGTKYKGMTLGTIASQVTPGGQAKGIEYLEWFTDQKPKTPEVEKVQEIIRKFLKDFKQCPFGRWSPN